MNGYLARLMRQSAIQIARPDSGPKLESSVLASDTVAPVGDIAEEETTREAPVFQQPAVPAVRERDPEIGAVAKEVRTQNAPAERRNYGAATPQLELRQEVPSVAAPGRPAVDGIPFVSIATATVSRAPNEQMPAGETHPSVSPAKEEIPSSTPTAQEIVHEVVAWMTEPLSLARRIAPTNQAAPSDSVVEMIPAGDAQHWPEAVPSAWSVDDLPEGKFERDGVGVRFPADVLERNAPHSAEGHSHARPNSRAEPWSVQIDSIQLTIEEPAVKPAPPPITPRVAPTASASSSQFTPSQLRRHYLRPF